MVDGKVILSEGTGSWADVFAALSRANVPGDLSDAELDRRPPEYRPSLDEASRDESTSPEPN